MTQRTVLPTMVVLLLAGGCSLFEPREPEQPSQSGSNLPPPTTADIVVSNLQSSISSRNLVGYMGCFSNPATNPSRGLIFIPSPDYIAQLQPWSYSREYTFMQDLISRARPNGLSSLILIPVSSLVSSDSVDYQYVYTFTFETTPENNFTSRAHGRVEFKVGLEDSRTRWSIYYWADSPENPGDTTWSAFKRKFSGS